MSADDGKPPEVRTVIRSGALTVARHLCHAGPADRAFEERHGGAVVALVLGGTFTYRCDRGRAVLGPGSLLLGNAGACFECGHDHSTGDDCLAVHLDPDLYGEIAASAAGSGTYRFRAAAMPAPRGALPSLAGLQALLTAGDAPLRGEEAAIALTEAAVRADFQAPGAGREFSRQDLSPQDHRRVARALSFAEAVQYDATLDSLAAAANTSKYHFLRIFRRAMGRTPYQYLLSQRIRLAARRLASDNEPVTEIAAQSGFPDLSTFIHRFKREMGETPSAYRARTLVPTTAGKPAAARAH